METQMERIEPYDTLQVVNAFRNGTIADQTTAVAAIGEVRIEL
jgi:hypothetical protein